jgi:hypothetical protein
MAAKRPPLKGGPLDRPGQAVHSSSEGKITP